jgi:hypothetical protein
VRNDLYRRGTAGGGRVSISAWALPATGYGDVEGAPMIPPGARVWLSWSHRHEEGHAGRALLVQIVNFKTIYLNRHDGAEQERGAG